VSRFRSNQRFSPVESLKIRCRHMNMTTCTRNRAKELYSRDWRSDRGSRRSDCWSCRGWWSDRRGRWSDRPVLMCVNLRRFTLDRFSWREPVRRSSPKGCSRLARAPRMPQIDVGAKRERNWGWKSELGQRIKKNECIK
jgi:hypothetical protein